MSLALFPASDRKQGGAWEWGYMLRGFHSTQKMSSLLLSNITKGKGTTYLDTEGHYAQVFSLLIPWPLTVEIL